jgi:hypothetical protein
LAQGVLARATDRILSPARLRFDYAAHGAPVSTLKPLRGKSGLLTARLVSVAALGELEQHLVVAAITDDGQTLAEDDAEKLLRLPATEHEPGLFAAPAATPAALATDAETRKQTVLHLARERQLRYFEQEVVKLDAWADDLKLGLEQRIKDIDREIKEVRRSATISATLDEKLHWQKRQRELEGKRSQLRRELFGQQDEIEVQRNAVIEGLERQLMQQVDEKQLFTVEWELM